MKLPKYSSQKHPQTHNSDNFQSLFEFTANKLGVGTEIHAIRVCHQATKIIQDLFKERNKHFRVQSYKNNILTVLTNSSASSQQFLTKSHLLQTELQKIFGEKSIQKIAIKVSDKALN